MFVPVNLLQPSLTESALQSLSHTHKVLSLGEAEVVNGKERKLYNVDTWLASTLKAFSLMKVSSILYALMVAVPLYDSVNELLMGDLVMLTIRLI
jgi:hypothetical protein